MISRGGVDIYIDLLNIRFIELSYSISLPTTQCNHLSNLTPIKLQICLSCSGVQIPRVFRTTPIASPPSVSTYRNSIGLASLPILHNAPYHDSPKRCSGSSYPGSWSAFCHPYGIPIDKMVCCANWKILLRLGWPPVSIHLYVVRQQLL